KFRNQWIPRHVTLIGIDEKTYASVSDFRKFLLNEKNRKALTFNLHEAGYDERLGNTGWPYRRIKETAAQTYEEEMQRIRLERRLREESQLEARGATTASDLSDPSFSDSRPSDPGVANIPVDNVAGGVPVDSGNVDPTLVDPSMSNPTGEPATNMFDGSKDQFTGLISGYAIATVRHRSKENEVHDTQLFRPGDDVKLTFPTAGESPTAANVYFTVTDLYESKMSEYDSTLVFVPLSELQRARGMIHDGVEYATAIQIKLRKGADLEECRDRLRARFPADRFGYRIQTWKEMQGALLAAVQMETTILNILLFLIIAVAGFGILATFFMIVVEKTKDIGILKSLGAPSFGVMSIFLNYGLTLGAVGSGVGMVLGLLFVANINSIADVLESITGVEVFDPTIYYFDSIPVIINPVTVVWVVLGSMFIAVLASVLPAIRAARLHPVEALRYE
ncbi:MAG: lipoprotein-releasing system permease protein, partial [Pirellulaceae bacterium]